MIRLLSALTLLLAGCMVGEIEGAGGGTRNDSGASSGGHYPGDDLPDPSSDEPAPPPPPAEDSGAPAPPAESVDSGAPPPPPPMPSYPPGPYGLSVGYVIPNLTLQGYRDGAGSWTSITLADYFDPTGARGIKGVLVSVAAAWCGPCKEEARQLVDLYGTTYKARGARFLTAMIEDPYRNPAKQSTVDAWITYAGTNFDIVADPESRLFRSGASLPFNVVFDPRTMKVTKTWSGADPYASDIPALDAVIAANTL